MNVTRIKSTYFCVEFLNTLIPFQRDDDDEKFLIYWEWKFVTVSTAYGAVEQLLSEVFKSAAATSWATIISDNDPNIILFIAINFLAL